ncbi:sulfatase-like hydrolase/transferase [uncultured Draconibacterium sp.]|uniref:sulfatase-like hydrolase/transferase n=1 Tax=uncultured Draconibacterium sp. TaxID=1573823 RepID=UPI0025E388CC|nr:sulfatase-like hydrolase/transferase [uncultured Draconibacterium sp.]
MNRILAVLMFAGVFVGCSNKPGNTSKEASSKQPNILVVLCDDLGYADVGFNGSPDIKTPNLDQLATNGMIFSSAYVTHPFCGPSRASIMTGRYAQNIGTPYNLYEEKGRTDDGVPVSETFISNVLQDAGYYTAAVGKWHLGFSPRFQPNNRGFDEFYGFLSGGHDYFPERFSAKYQKQKEAGVDHIWEYLKPLVHDTTEVEEKEYITDALSRETIRIINETSERQKPFFIYLAYNAPHVPLQAKEEDMAQFPEIEDKDRKTYAGMVYAVDRGVGDIINTLKENGQFENTLIVFLSDNGGNTDRGANNAPLQGRKGDAWEGGFRTPMFFHYPEKIKPNSTFDIPVSALDFYPTFAELAGAKIPKGKILDGTAIMDDILEGKEDLKDRPVYVCRYREDYVDAGTRMGDWKLTKMYNEDWKLFKINEDLGEANDVSTEYPEKLQELKADMYEWTKGHVKPLWCYTPEDQLMWDKGVLPNYRKVFNITNN